MPDDDVRRVYVRAGTIYGPLDVAVEGVTIHGGLTDDWTLGEGRTVVTVARVVMEQAKY